MTGLSERKEGEKSGLKWSVSLRKANHEPLISLETFEKIRHRLAEGKKTPARKEFSGDFPLRGFVTCADCGKPLPMRQY